jgi:ribonuclease BN (tRNA processing enzyme)
MKLHVVGCSPAWPNPGGAHSGYLVEQAGQRLLIDCGPGVLSRLRMLEPWPQVDAIAISHLHLDHWGDLIPWSYGLLHGPGAGSPRPVLWLPPGATAELELLKRVGGRAVVETFAPREYADGVPFAAAGLELTPVRTAHYGEASFGLRIAAGGAVLAYSADSGPAQPLVELARDADVFLCEATLAEPEQGTRGHLTGEEMLAAFRASGAKRLLAVHRPGELPLPEGVERAYDGLELEL